MSLQDLPGQHTSSYRGQLGRAVREEVLEVVWLFAVVGALSVAGVTLAVVVAGGMI
jgi:hypothetical protein